MLRKSMLAAAFLSLGAPAFAADDMMKMDTNHDGTVSREEYMKYHEAMWDRMKKNKDGGVDVKAMKGDAMKGDAMKSDAMKGDAMKGDAMKGDAMKGDSTMKY
jgi:pentapeptide MXKDX repeat protein